MCALRFDVVVCQLALHYLLNSEEAVLVKFAVLDLLTLCCPSHVGSIGFQLGAV